MHTQEFGSDWPAALDDILEFVILTQLSLGRGRPGVVRVSLSRERVAPDQLQPHINRFRQSLAQKVPGLRLELGAGHHASHRVDIAPLQLSFTQARQRCVANPRDEACLERPIKLYVAAVKSEPDKQGRHDKVIAVISERNWYLPDKKLANARRERVHGGTNDLDNVSTEIAMRIVGAAWTQKQATP